MIWWQWLIIIAFYFICLWGARLVFLILVVKIAGSIKKSVEDNVKEKLKGLKGEDNAH